MHALRRKLKPLVGVAAACAIFHVVTTSVPPVSALLGGIAEPRFKFEGLIDVGSLGLQDVDGLIAAVGDVDGNQLLSLFILSPDQRTVKLFEWDRAAYTFKFTPNAEPVSAPFVVTNVVPGDFNYDGRLDMLLMGQDSPAGWFSDDELKMVMHRGAGHGLFEPAVAVPSSHLQQPTLLDADGSMQVDMIGYPFSKDSKKQDLKLWKNAWQQSNGTNLFTINEPPLQMDSFDCNFPNPHSNAFVDLDGDCLADLFLVCQDPANRRLSYRILTNTKSSGFQLVQTGQLPLGAGQVSFADMDRDGTLDMVFPTCGSDGCYINIVYNQQMPLCTTTGGLTSRASKTSDQRCRESSNLCIADPQFAFNLSPDASNGGYQRIPLTSLLPGTPYLVQSDASFNGKLPNPIRIGDFNKDGYPDLLVVASSRSSPQQGNAVLLESLPCAVSACGEAASKASRRTFKQVDGKTAQALNSINDAKSAFWLDIDEDGTLDIVVQRAGQSSGASRKITFIKNNFYHDTFFLKTLFGNGACNSVCISSNGTQYNPYGVSYSGASYKFTVLDTTGTRRATQVGQLPQTGYMSLQTPYSYFGLGRTNNYVENLFVGSSRHQPQHFTSIEGLIPNSQVVIVPYQPANAQTPETWDRQLFLQPGKWIPWVGVALLAALFCLAITVMVLHINEKRQDEIERRKAQHLINFDAL